MVVKVFKSADPNAAIITTQDHSIRYPVALDDALRNKMCRRDRAYFEATVDGEGHVALHKRLPNQNW